MPKTLLVKNAAVLVTMDAKRRELRDAGLFIEDNRIIAVGSTAELPATADEVLDLRGHIVLPGLINTHHRHVSEPHPRRPRRAGRRTLRLARGLSTPSGPASCPR